MTVRMRTIPTEAERAAHNPGPWLCRDEWGNPRVGYWTKLGFESGRLLTAQRVAAWTFWPCDENLNKVEIDGFRFADCAPEKGKRDPEAGHIWREKSGRRRTARIAELHTEGFGESPRAVLTVLTSEGPLPFRKNLRLCRNQFALTWEFFRAE
mgnify:FL=1